jgi:hypothetical protein
MHDPPLSLSYIKRQGCPSFVRPLAAIQPVSIVNIEWRRERSSLDASCWPVVLLTEWSGMVLPEASSV